MTVTTIGTSQVHVDAEGFLTDYDEWSEDLARQLAAQIGIELTDAHFTVLRFLRSDYAGQGETATLRRVSTQAGIPDQGIVHPIPRQASQEDGLYRRAAQASRLRVSAAGEGGRPGRAAGRRDTP